MQMAGQNWWQILRVPFISAKLLHVPVCRIKKLAQIKCAHIPEIYYYSEAYGKTYVIEEFISGETLAAELEQGKKFTAEQVRNIALQICEALIVLHGHGILHRDIKPGNIIVQGSGVWLIDFGAAKAEGNTKEHDTVILGTPGFAPPEQYGFTTTDARSDIYALGKNLWKFFAEVLVMQSFVK